MKPKDRKHRRISLSERLYGLVLLVYPAVYRREYGFLMQQAFRDLYGEARQREGWLGVLRLWKRVLRDVGWTALDEHLDAYEHGSRMKKILIEEAIRTMALMGIVLFGILPVAVTVFDLDPVVVGNYTLPIPFLLFPIFVVVRMRTGYRLQITTQRQWNIAGVIAFLLNVGLLVLFATRDVISWSKAGVDGLILALMLAAIVLFGPRMMHWPKKH
jgi:hypothetical protein